MNEAPAVSDRHHAPLTFRVLAVVYGAACYLVFLASFLYAIGFVGNLVVPKSIDKGPQVSLAEALTADLLLLGLFAVQHSVMARPSFKKWWTRFVPPPVERSSYVLASSLLLLLLFWQWRPIPGAVWDVQQPVVAGVLLLVFGVGWLIVLVSTFLIDHFDLFGLRQVYLYASRQPYTPPPFRAPALYRVVRHPIMLGFVVAFWATPTMTWGHLLFAGTTTAYLLVGVTLEEGDLRAAHGDDYEKYRQRVSMIVPWRKKMEE
ncbi:MAG TPA: NnrU family protein [Gemmatales bacterium]|nr:NnrU family protein [Gemmatales bacterium]